MPNGVPTESVVERVSEDCSLEPAGPCSVVNDVMAAQDVTRQIPGDGTVSQADQTAVPALAIARGGFFFQYFLPSILRLCQASHH